MTSEDRIREQILDKIIPDITFSGSLDEVKQKYDDAIAKYEEYKNNIPESPNIPTIEALAARFVPPIPSYGEVKAELYNKFKKLKQDRQEAAIEASNAIVEQAKDGFGYRQQMMERANSIQYIRIPSIRNNNNR